MNIRIGLLTILLSIAIPSALRADEVGWPMLTGTPIGSASVDYDTGRTSTTVNQPVNAFDGDYKTFYASYDRSNTWVGLDLGKPHVIHAVGWMPREAWPSRVRLAVFEGANRADFSDALPLYIVPEDGIVRTLSTAEVDCTRAFRYVRYVGPNNVRCNVAEVAFYGEEAEGSDEHLTQLTNLPTLVVNIEGGQTIDSREVNRVAHVSLVSRDGTKILETDSTLVRGRGNGSWTFPKKPFRMKFQNKHRMPGAAAKDKKWTVINNYGDKTLMRNMLGFEMSRIIGFPYTPYCQPVDVVVNGEYWGNYQLCDQVEVGDGRVDIVKTDEETGESGYLIEIDAYANEEPSYFTSAKSVPVTIHYPDAEDITITQKNYIKTYFAAFETALYSSKYTDEMDGFRKYFDAESLLRYIIVEELSGNTDALWSMYIYKNPGERMYVGPVWDLDLAFENDNRTYPINNLTQFIYMGKGSVASSGTRNMVNRIVNTDPEGRKALSRIWTEARINRDLTPEHFDALIDSLADVLDESQRLNFVRWPILNTRVHQNPRTYGSYEGEVENVRKFLHDRFDWMDNYIGLDKEIMMSTDRPTVDFCFCYPEAGGLRLAAEIDAPVEVFTTDGRKVAESAKNAHFIALSRGLYIVRMGHQSRKVRVN